MITKKWISELPYELPNDLRKLENFRKIREILGFDGHYPAGHPRVKL